MVSAAGLNGHTIVFTATGAGKALSPAGIIEVAAGHLPAEDSGRFGQIVVVAFLSGDSLGWR